MLGVLLLFSNSPSDLQHFLHIHIEANTFLQESIYDLYMMSPAQQYFHYRQYKVWCMKVSFSIKC